MTVHHRDCERAMRKRKWRRKCGLPVEYDPAAGFEHAKHGNRQSIRVQADNGRPQLWVAHWNDLADWELFVVDADPEPEIFVEDAASTGWSLMWVPINPPNPTPYDRCRLFRPPNPLPDDFQEGSVGAHELGHALGFLHYKCGVMDSQMTNNRKFDRALLKQVGYV